MKMGNPIDSCSSLSWNHFHQDALSLVCHFLFTEDVTWVILWEMFIIWWTSLEINYFMINLNWINGQIPSNDRLLSLPPWRLWHNTTTSLCSSGHNAVCTCRSWWRAWPTKILPFSISLTSCCTTERSLPMSKARTRYKDPADLPCPVLISTQCS